MKEQILEFLLWYEYSAITLLFLANSSYLILLVLGYINSRKKFLQSKSHKHFLPDIEDQFRPISILVPAYNEASTITQSILSLLKVNYTQYEIIVINDGSKDNTMQELLENFQLKKISLEPPQVIPTQKVKNVYISQTYENLIVLDKENGGKSDALNAGIVYSNFPLISCIDSDSLLDREGLMQLSYPFFEYPDEVVATGGTIRVANNLEISARGEIKNISIKWGYLSLIQIVEYLRAFLVGRMGWDYLNSNIIISGAFGLFSKKAVIELGGYMKNTVGEDLELLLRIHENNLRKKRPYRVFFLPDPVCWTEVPENLKALGNQRSRWQQGLFEGIFYSRRMLFRPWSKTIGMLALPYMLLFELLTAPIELMGYVVAILGLYLGAFELDLVLLFLSVSILYGWLLTLCSVIIEELTFRKYKSLGDYFKLFIGVLLEQLGYHQLHLYWRLRGMYRFLRRKSDWGEMTRKGFKKKI